ncbi:MAG: hypothetical protein AB8B95_01200 [Pseudohongiellaceae bacterium]
MTNTNPIVNFVVAHSLEAAPVIEKFRLRKVKQNTAFPIYEAGRFKLVVCGMGKVNAAAGTAYLATVGQNNSIEESIWINLGIAGHQSLRVGETLVIHKVREASTDSVQYPFPIPSTIVSCELITVDVPERDYPLDVAYDMEGWAFWETARKFSRLELVQLLKVVSDNRDQGIDTLTKSEISKIMQGLCENLDEVVGRLQEIAAHYYAAQSLPDSFFELRNNFQFSVTQSLQLKRACQRFKATGIEHELECFLTMKKLSSKDLLQQLEARLDKLVL